MLMRYTFESPTLSFDGHCLSIKHIDKILNFTNIDDFDIEGSRVSFLGDYIPKMYDVIKFKLKNNPNEHLGRFIKFTHDRTGIEVEFSFDRLVQFPRIKSICYSDVEIVTFINISDNVIYRNVWKSMDYIYDEKTGIIRKDLWIPKHNDQYYYIDTDGTIEKWLYDEHNITCKEQINIFNCFKTEQEAEIIRDQFLKLLSER